MRLRAPAIGGAAAVLAVTFVWYEGFAPRCQSRFNREFRIDLD